MRIAVHIRDIPELDEIVCAVLDKFIDEFRFRCRIDRTEQFIYLLSADVILNIRQAAETHSSFGNLVLIFVCKEAEHIIIVKSITASHRVVDMHKIHIASYHQNLETVMAGPAYMTYNQSHARMTDNQEKRGEPEETKIEAHRHWVVIDCDKKCK